ncbi:MAG: AEC family transporter [Eubacteriales bacterium]|nr:AEC family transporter [Eubacteriales bacterium]
MLSNLIFSLNHTLPLFALMVLGYLLHRKNFMGDSFVADANKLVFHVALPVLLFMDLAQTDIRASFDAAYVGYCAAATLSSILVIWGLARLLLRDKTQIGEFVQGSYRSSAAILGVAFVQLIYGDAGMSGLMILGCVPLYNIFAVLILVMENPARYGRGTAQKEVAEQSLSAMLRQTLVKIVTNPIILGLAAGFFWGFFRIPVPEAAGDALTMIGNITTPLALLAIGAGFKGKEALSEGRLTAAATAIKLMVLPAVFLPLAAALGFTGEKLVGILVMLGSITTPASYVMARQMGHKGTLTGSICVATTLFSPLSLTFWLFLADALHWL